MTAMQLWDFPGGIHPPDNKRQSTTLPIQRPPLPKRLVLSLEQHIGMPAEPLVRVGERVLKGQPIAAATGFISVPLHAPTSGTVGFIDPRPYPHVSGLPVPAIVIDSDGRDEWCDLQPCPDFRSLEPADLLARIRAAGIAGLGGAGFPTEVKLSARATDKIHTLLINGAECEPYISADDMLMREQAAELVGGIDILVHLLQPEQVLIGIEDNKPEAIAAVRAALGERPWQLREFPTKYPSGGEKQLIQILTGSEVPSGGLPADIGIVCQNVGTVVAVYRAVVLGQPLVSRIVTLTGAALERPMNVEALLGTPVGELLDFAGLHAERLDRLILGGPMMGFTLPSTEVPLIKTSNCLLAATAEELPPPPPAMACIRCGECAEVCPASLLPQQLHFFALGQEHEQLRVHHLFDCIECGACAYVCPSSIPLVQYYRAAKAEIRELEQKHQKAEQARLRFEQRQERLRREEERREAERKARQEKAERARARSEAAPVDALARVQAQKPGLSDEQKRLKIAASMAQVALKKAEKQLALHATPELQTQVDELRTAAEEAQRAFEAAQAAEPADAPVAGEAERKQAKIRAAMLRVQLKKLEGVAGETPSTEQQAELQAMRAELDGLQPLLDAPAAPASPDGVAALKRAKIDLAMKRAELKKAEQAGADEAELERLRNALATAEQALHAAEDASGKPVPNLVRIDKRPVDETTRALKTELAYARADLRKLERDEQASAEALQAARERLMEAERKLEENKG
ncbi:electron transport complex subunit RsxC [Zestomonas carbonaria]|uniref:Ion-translocating oxidoreductase complex subunit C n=1 Tax=Zestomonas carbonaria TaxID=2762745 RepID=A0A7U7IA93_9GAMM|nr:electron transport complex subunit RsxC [Pseudomonas carbonaria]CAD5109209.1 Ion-translocating oxidoreductase complex subunit C [Pseudomonas carbonaria]